MRKIVALFVLVLILLQSFSKMGVYLSFKINQIYIANTLCINKAKPQLHCNGKCYLAKKLRQAEQQEQKQQAFSLKLPDVHLCCQQLHAFCFSRLAALSPQSPLPPYTWVAPSPSLIGIFHPPQV